MNSVLIQMFLPDCFTKIDQYLFIHIQLNKFAKWINNIDPVTRSVVVAEAIQDLLLFHIAVKPLFQTNLVPKAEFRKGLGPL